MASTEPAGPAGSDQVRTAPPGDEHRRRHDAPAARWWWLAAGTFLIGVIAGGLVVGFAGWGAADATVAVSTSSVAPSSAISAPTPAFTPGLTGQITVNTACLAAINDAQQAFDRVGELVGALKSFNPGAIDDVIRQLQPLQSRLRNDLGSCNVITQLPNGGLTTVTPGPSGSIPVSPTS